MAKLELNMSEKMMDLVARRFRTLGEPYRLRILQALESGEMSVKDMVSALEGNQPNISKHLQILHEAGLVGRRRAGNTIFYSIIDPMVFKLCDLVCRSEAEKGKRELDALGVSTSPARSKR
jgi:DNA-binding transcriptional ArsR family regulator